MFIYLIVFGVATGAARVAEVVSNRVAPKNLPRQWSLVAFAVAIFLASISALRWRVGTDYWTYDAFFPMYAEEVYSGSLSWASEPGLRIIAWLAMEINGDSATMFALAAFITIGLMVRSLWRWSPLFSFSIALFILSGTWHGSFNGIRQFLACAILFAGHRYIVDRKFWKWTCIVVIAFFFHTSAIVGLLLYFVPTRRISFKIHFFLIAVGLVALIGMDSLISFMESLSTDSARWDPENATIPVSPLRVAFAFLPLLIYWLFDSKENLRGSGVEFYLNMLAVFAAVHVASATSTIVARFIIYGMPFLAIGLVYATEVRDKKQKVLLRLIVLSLFAIFFYFDIQAAANLRNFQWIFQRP